MSVCTVKGAGEADGVECLSSSNDEIKLVPALRSWMSPGDPVQWLGLEIGVGNAELMIAAQL